MLIGFSTGCLYKTHERVAAETFEVIRALGCNAIEIACCDDGELEKLITQISPVDLVGFEYVSLHAPTIKGAGTLELLKKAHNIFNFRAIVIHPDEIENWDLLTRLKLPFSVENMDWRKEIGKYTESMQDIFAKFDGPMTLNLNHCYTNDPSMRLAKEMTDTFGGRIEEIHLSGFDHLHEPLFRTQQREILEAIPDKRLPIIIESSCESVVDAKVELEYVMSFLEQ